MPQQDDGAPELNQGEKIFKMVLLSHHQASEVLQPGKEAFDLPASAIAPELSSVLGLQSLAATSVGCNHLDVPIFLQSLIKSIAVVSFISDQSSGNFVEKPCLEGLLDKRYFMRRSAGHVHGDRKTRSVCHCHDLAALAPLGFSHGGAPFLAGANVPSMNASLRSMPPRSRRSSASVTRIRSNTPCFRQYWNRRWQVWYGGYRAGMSFQGAPVLRIQDMPSRSSRGGVGGLPLHPSWPFAGGIKNQIRAHCSLVRSMRTTSY